MDVIPSPAAASEFPREVNTLLSLSWPTLPPPVVAFSFPFESPLPSGCLGLLVSALLTLSRKTFPRNLPDWLRDSVLPASRFKAPVSRRPRFSDSYFKTSSLYSSSRDGTSPKARSPEVANKNL
eukprot:scaffold1264_cov540-Prasinococcus_capsulatus_cf.AAC.5